MDKYLYELGMTTMKTAESFVRWICDSVDRIKIVFGAMGTIVLGMFLWTAYYNPSFIRVFTGVMFYLALFSALAFILVAAIRKVRTKQ